MTLSDAVRTIFISGNGCQSWACKPKILGIRACKPKIELSHSHTLVNERTYMRVYQSIPKSVSEEIISLASE
jgi:hypothetical protein